MSFSSKKKTTRKNRSIDSKKCEYLPGKKFPIVMKTCFSDEAIWKTPLSKRTPLLSTNPPIS